MDDQINIIIYHKILQIQNIDRQIIDIQIDIQNIDVYNICRQSDTIVILIHRMIKKNITKKKYE